MNKKKILYSAALASLIVPHSVSAFTLVEVDFSGSGAGTAIASTDAQFTVKNAAADFTGVSLTVVGGSSNTASWAYDGTGTALVNNDLFTGSSFGSPTRLDLNLGNASSGSSYTLASAEVDIRASNNAATSFQFGYRDNSGTTQLLTAQLITVQSGADPISTYSVDLTGAGLSATDSSTTWGTCSAPS